ncbi:unnamed protein product, partial [Heterotrigona itama]
CKTDQLDTKRNLALMLISRYLLIYFSKSCVCFSECERKE